MHIKTSVRIYLTAMMVVFAIIFSLLYSSLVHAHPGRRQAMMATNYLFGPMRIGLDTLSSPESFLRTVARVQTRSIAKRALSNTAEAAWGGASKMLRVARGALLSKDGSDIYPDPNGSGGHILSSRANAIFMNTTPYGIEGDQQQIYRLAQEASAEVSREVRALTLDQFQELVHIHTHPEDGSVIEGGSPFTSVGLNEGAVASFAIGFKGMAAGDIDIALTRGSVYQSYLPCMHHPTISSVQAAI